MTFRILSTLLISLVVSASCTDQAQGIIAEDDLTPLGPTSPSGPTTPPDADGSQVIGAATDDGRPAQPLPQPVPEPPQPVPEPGTIFLMGAGLTGLAVYRKRRKHADPAD